MKRVDPPLIVRASPGQLPECPLELGSNQQIIPQPHADISALTEQINVMDVSTTAAVSTVDNASKPNESIRDQIPKVNYYQGPGKSVLMFMPHPCQLQFNGYLHVTIYYGHVYIFGNDLSLTSKKKTLTIFGSKSAKSIMIQTKKNEATDDSVLKKFLKSQMGAQSSEILAKLRPEDAVILIEELELPKLFLSNRYIPADLHPMSEFYTIFPEISKWLDCTIDVADSIIYKSAQPPDSWENLPITDRMMVIGGGSLGKSTLAKFLINRLLEDHDSVLYFELDIGQGDYLPPGTIGLVLVKEPAVGPGYVRVLPVERMIHLGDINVANCITTYLRSVAFLCKEVAKNYLNIPVVVNTMGFTKGQGFVVVKKLIRILTPKTVIQLETDDFQKNFKTHLTPEVVRDEAPINFDLRIIRSPYNEDMGKKDIGKNKIKRNRKLLASWSPMLRPPHYSFNSVKPYRVPFSSLMIGIMNSVSKDDILRALNGCMVALCEEPPSFCSVLQNTDADFFKLVLKPEYQLCLGVGLVRGIDADEKTLFLLTTLTIDQIRKVKMLVMSKVEVPIEIFMNQTVEGPVPYLVHNRNAESNAPIVRYHRSAVTK